MLAGVAGWVTDRLFEAGGEELIADVWSPTLSVPEAGKWTALAVLLGYSLGSAVVIGSWSKPEVRVKGMDKYFKPAADIPAKKAQEKKKAELMQMINQVQQVVLVNLCCLLCSVCSTKWTS